MKSKLIVKVTSIYTLFNVGYVWRINFKSKKIIKSSQVWIDEKKIFLYKGHAQIAKMLVE